jgi:phosphatidate phosphatase PAH1
MRNFCLAFLCVTAVGCSALPTTPIPIPIAPATKNQAVVFDIDGTLTPTILAISTARPYAAEVANAYAKKGYRIFYVSARRPSFQWGVASFLKFNGFPEGSFHLPSDDFKADATVRYKTGVLSSLHAAGWRFSYVYGDEETDAKVYSTLELGIAPERIFGLRRVDKGKCEAGFSEARCLKGWEEHLNFVASVPPASAD